MENLENQKSAPTVLDGGALPPKEAQSSQTQPPKSPFSATTRTVLQSDLEQEGEEEPFGTD